MATFSDEIYGSESRREAPALPVKRGEIGFSTFGDEIDLSSGVADVLNAGPHPAERRNQTASASQARSIEAPPRRSNVGSDSQHSNLSTASRQKHVKFRWWRSTKPNPRFGGLSNATGLRLGFLTGCIGGVAALWVLAVKVLSSNSNKTAVEDSNDPPAPDGPAGNATPSLVFVHITFSVAVIILLIFFERTVYKGRAERFTHLNPNALPQYRSRGRLSSPSEDDTMSENLARRGLPFAPWNRPPLPTYAAAVNFHGTGDVEDEAIAVPPPPEYGNTRGSTLLLAGLPSLREQQVPNSPPPSLSDVDRTSQRRSTMRGSLAASLRSAILALGGPSEPEGPQSAGAREEAVRETLAKLEEGPSPIPRPRSSGSRQS